MRAWLIEFRDFLQHEKARWLLPIVLVVAVLGVLLVLTQSDLGPFIYSRF